MDKIRYIPKDSTSFSMAEASRRFVQHPAVQWTTLTLGSVGAILGGIHAQRNQEPSSLVTPPKIEQPRSYVLIDTTCTGKRKAVASPDSLDHGMIIKLKVNMQGIPAQGTLLHVTNPRTGEEAVAGYYTPDETIPQELSFSDAVVDQQPSNKKIPEHKKKRLPFRPDDGLIFTVKKALPNGMYMKKEDLVNEENSDRLANITPMDIPQQGDIMVQVKIDKLCP